MKVNKLGKAIDLSGAAVKAVVGFGVSITVAALSETVVEKTGIMNGKYIDTRVSSIKKAFRIKK